MVSPVKCDGKGGVVIHIQHRHQAVVLEYKADIPAPENGQFLSCQGTDVFPFDKDVSLCGDIQSPNKIQKCRFAGAGGSDDGNKFAFLYTEADVL